jgi:hypothetical protein
MQDSDGSSDDTISGSSDEGQGDSEGDGEIEPKKERKKRKLIYKEPAKVKRDGSQKDDGQQRPKKPKINLLPGEERRSSRKHTSEQRLDIKTRESENKFKSFTVGF